MAVRHPQPAEYDISENIKGNMTLRMPERVNASNAAALTKKLLPVIRRQKPSHLLVDLQDTTYLDD